MDNELPTFPPPQQFVKTVRAVSAHCLVTWFRSPLSLIACSKTQRVKEHFDESGVNPKYSHWMLLRYFTVLVAVIWGYRAVYWNKSVTSSPALTLTSCVLFGWAYAAFCMTVVHDGSHGAFTHKPWVWDAMNFSYDFVVGNSHIAWVYQHGMYGLRAVNQDPPHSRVTFRGPYFLML